MRQGICLGSLKNPIWLGGALAGGMLLLATATQAANVLNIPSPTFSASSGANDNVKAECELPQKLASFIKDNAKGAYEEVNVGDAATTGTGRTLKIEFTNVLGVGGGAWSGPKSVTIQGTLTEGDKVIGTFLGRRTSTGGAFGGFKGTCAIIGRCVKTLGSDVGKWLQGPSMDAKLGEM